jgi:tetratricopeptide (TPR) repeat protein
MSSASIESRLRDVRELIDAGRFSAAGERCANLAQAAPNDSRIWVLSAEVSARSNNLVAAADFLRRAVDCAPDDAPLLIRYGLSLLRLGRRPEALSVALRAQALVASSAKLHDALGTLFTYLEEPLRALPHFRRAVERAPENVDFRYNLAMAQRMGGDLEAAEVNLDAVIAARPDDGEAYHARSDLRRQSTDRNHVASLESALSRLARKRASLPIAFALAKELEDLGEHARSFTVLAQASRTLRAALQYDVADDVAVLDRLRTTHTRAALSRQRAESDNEECIFIVGLPRSGTTLVEQILGSHSEVFAAGELDAFQRSAIDAVVRHSGAVPVKLEFVERSLAVEFTALGRAYLAQTRPRTGHTRRFTDKFPINYLYAGLIHAALPRARFIALHRHPLDTCYAMFRTLFGAAYPFTYALEDLGRYYVAWDRLMRHWQDVIGAAWLPVSYEALVTQPEDIARGIVAHGGLDWQPQCLAFSSRPSGVTSASAVQVRRPIHAESVGKWRHYQQELRPLSDYLAAHGISVD